MKRASRKLSSKSEDYGLALVGNERRGSSNGSLSLGCSWKQMEEVGCSLVRSVIYVILCPPHFPFHHRGGIGGPSYETPLRVVIALASFLGFGMVLLGKELELEVILSLRDAAIVAYRKELLEDEELGKRSIRTSLLSH
ncbi:hypothetical protein Tco_0567198 [Tanacetum coccineum]